MSAARWSDMPSDEEEPPQNPLEVEGWTVARYRRPKAAQTPKQMPHLPSTAEESKVPTTEVLCACDAVCASGPDKKQPGKHAYRCTTGQCNFFVRQPLPIFPERRKCDCGKTACMLKVQKPEHPLYNKWILSCSTAEAKCAFRMILD